MTDLDLRLARLRRIAPRLSDAERPARRRLPRFSYDFLQGGTDSETSRPRNAAALQAIEVVPRYGLDSGAPDSSARILGCEMAAPLVFAPVGMDGAIWPGATRHIASAARSQGLAHMVSSMAAMRIEDVAPVAREAFWFQLYAVPGDDHRVTFDLADRATRAGARVLCVTLDVPLPARRVRDMRHGLSMPPRHGLRSAAQAALRPVWLAALLREGIPRFANFAAYAPEPGTSHFVAGSRAGAGMTWDVLARLRNRWPGALIVKGILHPADAVRARALGIDGAVVSNHGGRQFDAAPAPASVLPAIRRTVGPDFTLLLDGGVSSGLDVLRALAIGADGVLVGRALMLALAAWGPDGAHHAAATLIDEFRIALGQSGAGTIAGIADLATRHPHAWTDLEFEGEPS